MNNQNSKTIDAASYMGGSVSQELTKEFFERVNRQIEA